ncbi:uncharacterized protein LOC119273055 [Triticum dicoccoides]|uniref:uncharacterized protein LOC119273055 n=1 Tax=Triticum dicoccoides TaxID=85692 RepID=UPI00188EC570|nr:uncharacterized protein LOC119273055 [Triticum dicoccoides]
MRVVSWDSGQEVLKPVSLCSGTVTTANCEVGSVFLCWNRGCLARWCELTEFMRRVMRRVMAASPLLLLLLVSLVSTAAATSNTSESWERKRGEEETRQIFREWKAMHGTTNSSLDEEEQRAYTMFKHRLGLIDRQWHDQGYSVFSWERGRSEEETRKIFAEWKARKPVTTYSSIAHEEHRYTIFKEDLRKIDQHNAGYAIGVHNNNRCLNQFSHLTQEEFEAVCCGFWPEEPSEAKLQRIGEIQELLRQAFTRPLI